MATAEQLTPEQMQIAGLNTRDEAWYQCIECKAERYWGCCEPTDNYRPMLRCEACRTNTRHRYVSMSEGQWQDYAALISQGRA